MEALLEMIPTFLPVEFMEQFLMWPIRERES